MDVTFYGLILIPVVVFLLTAAVAIFRAVVRFSQYLAKSETLQSSTEKSNREIADKLDGYINKTDTAIGAIREDVAILKYAIRGGNHHKDV